MDWSFFFTDNIGRVLSILFAGILFFLFKTWFNRPILEVDVKINQWLRPKDLSQPTSLDKNRTEVTATNNGNSDTTITDIRWSTKREWFVTTKTKGKLIKSPQKIIPCALVSGASNTMGVWEDSQITDLESGYVYVYIFHSKRKFAICKCIEVETEKRKNFW